MKAIELRQKRAGLVTQARALLDKAEAEKRDLIAEEKQQYDALMADVTKLTEQIEMYERQEALEAENRQSMGTQTRENGSQTGQAERVQFESRSMRDIDLSDPEFRLMAQLSTREYRQAFNNYLRNGQRRGLIEAGEQRSLQADSDIYGGFLYSPMQFVDQLIKDVDNQVFVRRYATVQAVTSAESLGAPSLDNDPADPNWTSELAIGSEDSTMSFGQKELFPRPLAKYIKVSRKLLRKVPSAEALVRNRLAYKFGVTLENTYLNGSGAAQPLGVFTASSLGISTSRDYSTGNTTTSISFDGLIGAKYTLKGQYWPRARWLFHRDALGQIAKLKDADGQYLWRMSVREGEPDRLLGLPFDMSEYAPNTFTASQYVGILADWSFYWIADALQIEIQRLDELYAATNQVGFIGRFETDGMPVLENAFVRVKLAAS